MDGLCTVECRMAAVLLMKSLSGSERMQMLERPAIVLFIQISHSRLRFLTLKATFSYAQSYVFSHSKLRFLTLKATFSSTRSYVFSHSKLRFLRLKATFSRVLNSKKIHSWSQFCGHVPLFFQMVLFYSFNSLVSVYIAILGCFFCKRHQLSVVCHFSIFHGAKLNKWRSFQGPTYEIAAKQKSAVLILFCNTTHVLQNSEIWFPINFTREKHREKGKNTGKNTGKNGTRQFHVQVFTAKTFVLLNDRFHVNEYDKKKLVMLLKIERNKNSKQLPMYVSYFRHFPYVLHVCLQINVNTTGHTCTITSRVHLDLGKKNVGLENLTRTKNTRLRLHYAVIWRVILR